MSQRSNNREVELELNRCSSSTVVEEYNNYSRMHVVVRRSSVETKEQAELVRQMTLKVKKVQGDINNEQPHPRVSRQHKKKGSKNLVFLPTKAPKRNSGDQQDQNQHSKPRQRRPDPMRDPNLAGYESVRPRKIHRHEHQRQRAQEYENFKNHLPLRTGISSDEED